MSALSILYVILFYVAMLTLVVGVTNKILQYIRVPAPLKIALTPAPLPKLVLSTDYLQRLFYLTAFGARQNGHGYLAGSSMCLYY